MREQQTGIHALEMDKRDILYAIQEKLTVISDLLNFVDTMEMHDLIYNFRKETFPGMIKIIDGCIDDLDVIIPAVR